MASAPCGSPMAGKSGSSTEARHSLSPPSSTRPISHSRPGATVAPSSAPPFIPYTATKWLKTRRLSTVCSGGCSATPRRDTAGWCKPYETASWRSWRSFARSRSRGNADVRPEVPAPLVGEGQSEGKQGRRRAVPWVAGVDGCRAGWVVVLAEQQTQRIREHHLRLCPHFAEVFTLEPKPVVIAIDIPIG